MAIELVIAMNEQGQVNVTGPLEDRVLCYGLLEIAKEVIAKQGKNEAPPKPRIIPALGPLSLGPR